MAAETLEGLRIKYRKNMVATGSIGTQRISHQANTLEYLSSLETTFSGCTVNVNPKT
jgi:hypothetical protein